MSVILGYQELLLDGAFGALEGTQAEPLRRAHRSAAELLDLVNATLDLSRLETRRVPLVLQDVALARLLDDVAAEVAVPAEKSELRLFWNPPPDGLAMRTDAVKARMVLKNLVGNAIKFTERGRVTVAAHARAGGVELSVSDTGIGIATDDQRSIFEPFRQVDPARRYGGAGLGLYIVKRLLDALGGRVSVESALGQGATFRVWLPLHPGAE
jgi:signal transduction histidine kinase